MTKLESTVITRRAPAASRNPAPKPQRLVVFAMHVGLFVAFCIVGQILYFFERMRRK